jgi:hypothetical protein
MGSYTGFRNIQNRLDRIYPRERILQPFIVKLLDAPYHHLIVLSESYDDVGRHVAAVYSNHATYELLQCWAGESSVFPFSPLIFKESEMAKPKEKPKPKPKEKETKKGGKKTLKGGLG